MKPETFLYRLALVVMLATSLTMAFRSSARAAGMQEAGGAGPSFPCENTLACMVSAFRKATSRKPRKSEAERSLLCRRATIARTTASMPRRSRLPNWNAWLPGTTEELRSCRRCRHPLQLNGPRGLLPPSRFISWRMRDQKPVPEVYVRDPGADRFLKMSVETGAAQPANLDRSVSFYVYRNVAERSPRHGQRHH